MTQVTRSPCGQWSQWRASSLPWVEMCSLHTSRCLPTFWESMDSGIHAKYCFAFLLYLNHFLPFPIVSLSKFVTYFMMMTISPYEVRLWLPLVTMWPLACVQAGAGRLLSSALLPVSQELASGPHHCWPITTQQIINYEKIFLRDTEKIFVTTEKLSNCRH